MDIADMLEKYMSRLLVSILNVLLLIPVRPYYALANRSSLSLH